MSRTRRFGVMLAAAGLSLAVSPGTAQAASASKLKICVYVTESGNDFGVDVDGASFASFPDDGSCRTRKLFRGAHRIVLSPGTAYEVNYVTVHQGNRDGYSLGSRERLSVLVSKNTTTRVDVFIERI